MNEYYGTVDEADTYFANRLHEEAWTLSSASDKPKALIAATRLIDALRFKGCKTVTTQALEFPRDTATEVPEPIRVACYEIAHALLDGADPDTELENLGLTSQKYASVSVTYSRDAGVQEHTVNRIPSPQAWAWLRPYLKDEDAIYLNRVS